MVERVPGSLRRSHKHLTSVAAGVIGRLDSLNSMIGEFWSMGVLARRSIDLGVSTFVFDALERTVDSDDPWLEQIGAQVAGGFRESLHQHRLSLALVRSAVVTLDLTATSVDDYRLRYEYPRIPWPLFEFDLSMEIVDRSERSHRASIRGRVWADEFLDAKGRLRRLGEEERRMRDFSSLNWIGTERSRAAPRRDAPRPS